MLHSCLGRKLSSLRLKPLKEQQVEQVIAQRDVTIRVDEYTGFYRKADLSSDEVDYLLRKGYVLSLQVPLSCSRSEEYLLKPTGNQSAAHFFLVRAIAQYIERIGGKPKISDSFGPDARFVSKRKKKIAVEVETGVTHDRRKDLLLKKIEWLNRWYDDWFFVVSDVSYADKYRKFGKTFTRTNVCRKLRSYFNKWNQKTRNLGFGTGRKRALPAYKVKRSKKALGW